MCADGVNATAHLESARPVAHGPVDVRIDPAQLADATIEVSEVSSGVPVAAVATDGGFSFELPDERCSLV